ncbi:hypothetical protein KY49_719 [Burkholderia sp. MSHR3999]|uniref:hypothetical protein n=1 Tax=Burkholderia sp. MSHR3999 TaxID=1542965 RepID=UPI0005ACA90D|nr:hypothetical protein [Burkholderia sp. MSHR3999]KIP15102.1 hypothetical protein KY49_719 [Burkholderia sp. MSHR3999]
MQTKFVKPARGVVLMPERAYREMPADGTNVPVNPYYLSLLRFGDVDEAVPTTTMPKAAVSPATSGSAASSSSNS